MLLKGASASDRSSKLKTKSNVSTFLCTNAIHFSVFYTHERLSFRSSWGIWFHECNLQISPRIIMLFSIIKQFTRVSNSIMICSNDRWTESKQNEIKMPTTITTTTIIAASAFNNENATKTIYKWANGRRNEKQKLLKSIKTRETKKTFSDAMF